MIVICWFWVLLCDGGFGVFGGLRFFSFRVCCFAFAVLVCDVCVL